LTLLSAIGAITLAGILYKPTSPTWGNFSWSPLGALMIACTIVAIVFLIPILLAFLVPNRILLALAIILTLLSLMFLWAIGIMALIGATHDGLATTIGCRTNFDGFFTPYRDLEHYVAQADARFCTTACPCNFNNITAFSGNPTLANQIRSWVVSPNGATNFQSCPPSVHAASIAGAAQRNQTYYDQNFNQSDVWNYYNWMETEFQCSGWCGSSYTNPVTGASSPITRYVFSDINRGPPIYHGCINRLVEWLPDLLIAFGALALLTGLLMALLLIPLLLLCFARDKGEGTYVERRPVTVVERREPVVAAARV